MKENDFKSNETNDLQQELLAINIPSGSKNSDINENLEVKTEKNEKEKLSPYYYSTFFGQLLFNWSRYSMKLANKTPLKIPNFRGIKEKDQSKNLYKPLSEKWNEEKIKFDQGRVRENAFYKSILNTYYKKIIFLTILNLCKTIFDYLQIYFYDSVIQNFEYYHEPDTQEAPLFNVYINAISLVLCKLLTTFFHHQSKFGGEVA